GWILEALEEAAQPGEGLWQGLNKGLRLVPMLFTGGFRSTGIASKPDSRILQKGFGIFLIVRMD
ncbi:MAG TPA: hypothetical protein QGF50_05900, partial [Roseibacillus sp.]|nr:hypothetical protein [Roseibacillus sp.]